VEKRKRGKRGKKSCTQFWFFPCIRFSLSLWFSLEGRRGGAFWRVKGEGGGDSSLEKERR